MWQLISEVEKRNKITKHRITDSTGNLFDFQTVVELWQTNNEFNRWYVEQLKQNQWTALRWETPYISTSNFHRDFEFVLVNSPSLDRSVDTYSFANQFKEHQNGDATVIAFPNLGRNAIMVVPTPKEPAAAYCHLIKFLRQAEAAQTLELWKVVGREMANRVSAKPVWLSTAGGGVAWLHVRLDDRPKYYHYGPYRNEQLL